MHELKYLGLLKFSQTRITFLFPIFFFFFFLKVRVWVAEWDEGITDKMRTFILASSTLFVL